MKTIITAIAIITATLITATDTEASHKPDGKWQHHIEVDEFDDSQKHTAWHFHATEEEDIWFGITATCEVDSFRFFKIDTNEELLNMRVMRVRIGDLIKRFEIFTLSLIDSDYNRILIHKVPDIETIIDGMLSGKKVRFEIYTRQPFIKRVVSPDLEGFREVWEHVEPHCESY